MSMLSTKRTRKITVPTQKPCHRAVQQVSLRAEQGTGWPRRTVVREGAGEPEETGEVFDFSLLDHVLLEFHCNQNVSQKHFELAELADSD